MVDLKQIFEKEPKSKKVILGAAAAAFISTFLPWMSISFGNFGSVSANAWHRFGFLTVLGSIAMILDWVLPKVGVKYTLPIKDDLLQKILSLVILAGPVVWLIDVSFEFSLVGWGLYIGLAAGAVATYFTFVGGAKKGSTTASAPPSNPTATPPEAKN